MSTAVKVISEKPVYMSFDRVTIMELLPGEVYEIPDGFYEKRKHQFKKLSEAEVADMVKAATKEESKALKDDVKAAEEDAMEVDASPEGGFTLENDVARLNTPLPTEPEPSPAPAAEEPSKSGDDSVQSAAVTPQNKTVRRFQSKEDKS